MKQRSFLILGILFVLSNTSSLQPTCKNILRQTQNLALSGGIAVASAIGSYGAMLMAFKFLTKMIKHQETLFLLNAGTIPKEKKIVLSQEQERIVSNFEKEIHLKIPGTSLLFHGAPGNGKTYFAEYLAYRAYKINPKSKLFLITPSLLLKPMAGTPAGSFAPAEKISAIFSAIKIHAQSVGPTIVLFDEVDFAAKKRSSVTGLDEKALIAEFLIQMTESKIPKLFLLATTNYPESMDVAMLRDGRFGTKVLFDNPALQERKMLIKNFFKSCPQISFSAERLNRLATKAEGLSFASLNDSCIKACLALIQQENLPLKNEKFSLINSICSTLGIFRNGENKSNHIHQILDHIPERVNMNKLEKCLTQAFEDAITSHQTTLKILAAQNTMLSQESVEVK